MENGSRQQVQRASPHLESCPHVPVTLEDFAESGRATFTRVSKLLCTRSRGRQTTQVHICSRTKVFPSVKDVFTGCGTKVNPEIPLDQQ